MPVAEWSGYESWGEDFVLQLEEPHFREVICCRDALWLCSGQRERLKSVQ